MNFWMKTVIIVLGGILFLFLLDKSLDWTYNSIDKKHRKQYPRYFELRDEYNRISDYNLMNYHTYVEPLKEAIDYLLDNRKYLTEEAKRGKEKALEENRKELSIYLAEDEKSKREMEELRKALRAYVEENGIEK